MNNKKIDIVSLGLVIVILIMINFVGSFVFHRFDLTSEKRYTLSDATTSLVGSLDDIVYVKVYMGKNEKFPAGFKLLRNETREMLDEFRAYSNDNIEYEFINPVEGADEKQQDQIFKELYEKGLEPTNLEVKDEEGTSQKMIWPAALVSYHGREIPWQLLKTQLGKSPERQLNNSIQALEYEFASCIRNLTTVNRPRVGFINGHGELDKLSVADIQQSLSVFYSVTDVVINGNVNALKDIKAIIIAKPETSFSEEDKYIVDQYVMNGGKVIWAIDPLKTSLDSLRKLGGTVSTSYDLNIDNMLFKYGVRVNQNLVADLQSSAMPVNKAFSGQEPRWELMPWLFSPLIMSTSGHPIVKNLEMIKVDFGSTIDTVKANGIKKTILLQTSKYSKKLRAPVSVDMRMVHMKRDENLYSDPNQTIAVLLEGKFESVFKNRVLPQRISAKEFVEKGVDAQMIVIADGDIIRNEVQYSSQKPYPLGFDIYTQQTYGNKNFMLNCVNYLCDDSGLINVRTRELTMRLLDKAKVKNQQLKWQLLNVIVPLLALFIFGIAHHIIRKKKYTT